MRISLLSAWIALVLAAAPAWGAETSSSAPNAGINSFSAGAGALLPLGNDYASLGTAPAFQADLNVVFPGLGPDFDFRLTGFYMPFSVRNVQSVSATIGVAGLLAGVEFHAPGSRGKFSPYFGLQVGADYEFLSFSGASVGSSTNAGFSFGLRAIPGLEIPFSPTLSLLLEGPVQAMLGKHSVYLAGGVGSLRFHL